MKLICLLSFQIVMFYLMQIKVCKAATEVFNFDLTTTTVAGANVYSSFNGSNFMRMYMQRATPNHVSNYNSQGMIGERDDSDACTPANAVYNTGIVSFSMFVYIEDLSSKQYLYGEHEPEGTNFNRAFCMGLNGNNQAFIQINSATPITQDKGETQLATLTYQKGWNMIGVFSNDTGTQVYNVMPDGSTSSSGVITHINEIFYDADTYITCIGGRRTSTTTAQDAFIGMINEIRFYSDEVVLADLQALVDNTCDNPCPVCLAAASPTCVEDNINSFIADWDFSQATYLQTITDAGPGGLDIDLLDDQTMYDPIYVHNQGLYYDSTSQIRTAGTYVQNNQNSFTIEGWIRPTEENLDGDLVTFEEFTNVNDARIGFDKKTIEVQLSGVSTYIPITYDASDVGNWHYFGVSVHKISGTQSRVCGVFSTGAEYCNIIDSIFTLQAAGDAIQIGKKFNGMMREIKILDWPKVDYEFANTIQTAGCTAWDGVAGDHCPSATGTCISTCEKNQYGAACTDCLFPYCSSCFGGTNTQGYECMPDYTFDYLSNCPPEGGNGLIDAADGETGDDGNTLDNDGCSSACAVEPNWTCNNATAFSPSICVRGGFAGNYYGFQECSDGNLGNLDGCDSNCKIERGWKGIDGNPSAPDICTELCGDGINFGQHECDDGNNINGDGCDENGTVELPGPPMWLCSSGNEQAVDFCHEWCGDGFRHENPWLYNPRRNLFRLQEVTCDDGNLRSGEGCDGLCRIEEGFVGAGGNDTHPDVGGEEGGDRRHFYYDQGDDGNLDNDDGCDDGCHEEMGWEGLFGSPFKVTKCSEIGGDYRNRGWHTCDDGNVVDGDGCSSTCVTEARWYCTGGDEDNGDLCVEIGGDGYNDGTLECDDMNQLNGDGCDSTGSVEEGWEGAGGSITTKDTCLEIGGDSLDFGMWECDDGNNIDGDGCDSICMIEDGWDCLDREPSYCFKTNRPWISEYYIDGDTSLITIKFNTTMNILATFDIDFDMHVEMKGPKEPYDMNWKIVNQSKWITVPFETLYLSIDYNDQLFDYDLEKITVTFRDRSKIVSSDYKFEMVDTGFDLYLKGKEEPLEIHIYWGLYFFPIGYTIFIGIIFALMFLGFKGWIALDLVTTLQMIYLIPVARLYIPSVFTRFFLMFQYTNFLGLNFGFWKITQVVEPNQFVENYKTIGYNFDKIGFDTTSFFYNTTDVFIFIIYGGFVPAIIALSTEVLFMFSYIKKIDQNIKGSFFQFIITITMMMLTFSSFMNLYRFNVETSSESASSYMSVIYIIFLCTLFCYLGGSAIFYGYDIFKSKNEPTANLAAFSSDFRMTTFKGKYLFSEYRTESMMYYSYPMFFIFRRILVSCILIWWNDDGFYQLLFLSLLSVINLTYHCSYQPFEGRIRNISATLNEGMYLVICLGLFPYVYPQIEKDVSGDFAILFFVLFSLFFTFTLGFGIISMISKLFKNRDSFPINEQELEQSSLANANNDIKEKWLEGKGQVKTDYNDHKDDINADDPDQDEDAKIDQADTEEKQNESNEDTDESEEEESEEDDKSSSDSSDTKNPDIYANTRNIPNADVRIEDGFGTGMTSMRTSKIQQYRNFEKSGKLG